MSGICSYHLASGALLTSGAPTESTEKIKEKNLLTNCH